VSLTDDGRQAALYADLLTTESQPSSARAALWHVPIDCEHMDASPPCRVESRFSTSRAAPSPHGRRLSHDARVRTDGGCASPPCWHDGTERPIHRPADPEEQQDYESGKKTCHPVKNLLVIDETCHLCCLRDTSEGTGPDKRLAELAGYTLPRGSNLDHDRGCQGFMLDGITIIQPTKKPPGGELTPPEKAHNREISSIRRRIEYAIGGVKRYRMVHDKIRLLRDGIRDAVMETCCGLHNFRLQYRPWNYATQ
jgi:DDE superfamily endonuclease